MLRCLPPAEKCKLKLSLPLFEAWVFFIDYIQLAFSSYDLAICTTLFYGCPDFHFIIAFCFQRLTVRVILFVPENDPSPG